MRTRSRVCSNHTQMQDHRSKQRWIQSQDAFHQRKQVKLPIWKAHRCKEQVRCLTTLADHMSQWDSLLKKSHSRLGREALWTDVRSHRVLDSDFQTWILSTLQSVVRHVAHGTLTSTLQARLTCQLWSIHQEGVEWTIESKCQMHSLAHLNSIRLSSREMLYKSRLLKYWLRCPGNTCKDLEVCLMTSRCSPSASH